MSHLLIPLLISFWNRREGRLRAGWRFILQFALFLGFPVSGNLTDGSLIASEQGGSPLWSGGELGPKAGLIGLLEEFSLLQVFVIWGLRRGRFRRYAIQLVCYRKSLRRVPSIAPEHAVEAIPDGQV